MASKCRFMMSTSLPASTWVESSVKPDRSANITVTSLLVAAEFQVGVFVGELRDDVRRQIMIECFLDTAAAALEKDIAHHLADADRGDDGDHCLAARYPDILHQAENDDTEYEGDTDYGCGKRQAAGPQRYPAMRRQRRAPMPSPPAPRVAPGARYRG